MTLKENVEQKLNWETLLNQEEAKKSFIWDFRERDFLETFWISDVHIGHRCCDTDLFLKNLKFIKDNEIVFADLGDLVENATRNSIGAGIYEQEQIADAQIEMALKLYEPLKDLIQVMLIGNHDLRTFKESGVNITKQMAKRLGTKYGGYGSFQIIKVGNQIYKVYASHGGSSATTTGGKFNALKRIEDNVEADVVICGHMHEPIYHARDIFKTDERGQVTKRTQYIVANGAYLNWWGSYGQIKAYSPGRKGNAKINFYGNKRHLEVSFV